MGYQAVFKRYEIKYMVTSEQKDRILKAMEPYMELDRFGRSTVRNLYFDTDDFVLARHSIAKPDYKEKLRIRSYAKAETDSTVFVELKRKFDGIVYKRRIGLPETDAMRWMSGVKDGDIIAELEKESPQVAAEIEYFAGMYSGLRPVIYLSYDREAYRMKKDPSVGSDFRVTFDSNICCRESELTLTSDAYGTSLLEDGMYLMELKCSLDDEDPLGGAYIQNIVFEIWHRVLQLHGKNALRTLTRNSGSRLQKLGSSHCKSERQKQSRKIRTQKTCVCRQSISIES